MLGHRVNVSGKICDSRVVQIVGKETNTKNRNIKRRGDGGVLYWCVEVVEGNAVGPAFAVGSDEIEVQEDISCH